ncbi:MAG TPA: histidine kinase [Gemmatimonadaceae bacterium]|nr:histidine kinase [Gemmatimonadaceae bacterium]
MQTGTAEQQPNAREPLDEMALQLLGEQRERAERRLNAVRAVVLLLLAIAALVYAPSLTPALNRVNVVVLAPTLSWTIAQFLLFYRARRLPSWLATVNPVVDITAVTAIIGGYGMAQSPVLALKTPIFLVYLVILAARPVTSSARKAAAVSTLAVAEYTALVLLFAATGRLTLAASPVSASATPSISPLDEMAKLLLLGVAGGIATYATAWHERLATTFSRLSRDQEELATRLAEAQLQSLKLQLHPHFLFNTLNTITALIDTDPQGAERMVSGLSELLRLSLRTAGEQEVPLARELEILEHYVEIQQIRFADRLEVSVCVAPEARHALVPNLILQPLVENAIRHGIAPRAAPGHIEVRAGRRDGMLTLSVADDGVGLRAEADIERGEGIGLANTGARLQQLYGEHHRFELGAGRSGGFTVLIEIPFRPAIEAAEGWECAS